MQRSNRKELLSIGLTPETAEVIRNYAKSINRSTSETIRMIVEKFTKDNKLIR